MARLNLSDGWTANWSVLRLQRSLHRFLRVRGMHVVGEQAGEVHARQGRWPGRIFGGRLAPAAWLPKRAVIRLKQDGNESDVRATIEEAVRGSMTERQFNRYRAYFVRWMADLKSALR
jgi:hypothetical protein